MKKSTESESDILKEVEAQLRNWDMQDDSRYAEYRQLKELQAKLLRNSRKPQ